MTSAAGSHGTPDSADLHPGPGFQIRTEITRPDPDVVRRLAHFDTPTISDALNRLYAFDPTIRCLTGDVDPVSGPACTVRVFPGDNLMVHKALDIAAPGDVVVVDARGGQAIAPNAVLGDVICTKARHRGIAGFVVDGLVRDLPGIVGVGLPVYARGTTPVGPLHRGPGEVNFPIACGGAVVNPGDVILADGAGIVSVPQDVAEDLADRLEAREEASAAYLAAVRRGEFSNAWVDATLDAAGCRRC